MKLFIGIDSGVHGAIVELMPAGITFQFPLTFQIGPRKKDTRSRTRQEILFHLKEYALGRSTRDIAVCIEDPGLGIFGASKSTSCKLYGSFTELRMACEAVFGFSPREVVPRDKGAKDSRPAWIRHFGISPKVKGETQDHWKSRLADLARKKFPGVNIIVDCADAALIALYCKETTEDSYVG